MRKKEVELTQDRTPPISPSVYPVTKSFTLLVVLSPAVATPEVGLLGNGNPPPDDDPPATDDWPGPSGLLGINSPPPLWLWPWLLLLLKRAGLWGRDVGQY